MQKRLVHGKGREITRREMLRLIRVAMYRGYAAQRERERQKAYEGGDDEKGMPCVAVKDQNERWRGHFSKVLNTESLFIKIW